MATNSTAATMRIAFSDTRLVSASPANTAGTLAIIMPSVVPAVTARVASNRAPSAIVAKAAAAAPVYTQPQAEELPMGFEPLGTKGGS